MIIQIALETLLIVMSSLTVAIVSALWFLIHRLVFKPLDKIGKNIEKITGKQNKTDKELALLDLRVEMLETHTEI